MEILSFIIIQICIEFRHLGNSNCSGSWLAQLTFAVPYMAGWVYILLKLVHFPPSHYGRPNYASDARITLWKKFITL